MDDDDKIRRNLVAVSAAIAWVTAVGFDVAEPLQRSYSAHVSNRELWWTAACVEAYLAARFFFGPYDEEPKERPGAWITIYRRHFRKQALDFFKKAVHSFPKSSDGTSYVPAWPVTRLERRWSEGSAWDEMPEGSSFEGVGDFANGKVGWKGNANVLFRSPQFQTPPDTLNMQMHFRLNYGRLIWYWFRAACRATFASYEAMHSFWPALLTATAAGCIVYNLVLSYSVPTGLPKFHAPAPSAAASSAAASCPAITIKACGPRSN